QGFLKQLEQRYINKQLRGTTILVEKDLKKFGLTEDRMEQLLATSRVYMLIAKSSDRPADAYVSVRFKGQWYSIFDDDPISKETLGLIHQFNTVQSVPQASAPLTPSISVGAR